MIYLERFLGLFKKKISKSNEENILYDILVIAGSQQFSLKRVPLSIDYRNFDFSNKKPFIITGTNADGKSVNYHINPRNIDSITITEV